ncbi:MAG: transcriptional regulator [Euryarchaeota archaeon]|nr:transcriptional regulator [Euryarchaeota archaeon]
MENKTVDLTGSAVKIFKRAGFEVSLCDMRSCYDIMVRRGLFSFIVKILSNINSLSAEHGEEMKRIAYYFNVFPLVISYKTKKDTLEKGVVYSREDIPVISLETLENLLLGEMPPLVYADRGGLYVKIDREKLKREREKREISLGYVADSLNISRSTLYEYENVEKGVLLENAIKIENFFDIPVTKPVSILKEIEEDNKKINLEDMKKTLERNILLKLHDAGFKVIPTEKTPFNAFVKEREVIITGIGKSSSRLLKKRIRIVHEFSMMMEKDSMFIIDLKKNPENIEGVPILSRKELKKIKDVEGIFDLLIGKKTD